MTDLNSLLERADRAVSRLPLPTGGLERLTSLRERKRRNQRIAAGVVGMAVFLAAVWIVTTGGSFDRTQTPAVTGPTVPPEPTRVGFIGVPPEGATPSTPENGDLFLSYWSSPTRMWVYADGRLIWVRHGDFPYGANDRSTGYLEQRLTPEGAELMRSEVIASGLFGHDLDLQAIQGLVGEIEVHDGDQLVRVAWGTSDSPDSDPTIATAEQASAIRRLEARLADPSSWLPESAWEDPEIGSYVPSRYSVCFDRGNERIDWSRILNLPPEPASDLVRAGRESRAELVPPGVRCFEMTTEEARAFVGALDDAGVRQDEVVKAFGLAYLLWAPDPIGYEFGISLEPIFPHGEWTCSPCG